MDTSKRKRLFTVGGASLGIAAGSLAVGLLNPFTAANAQTTSGSDTTAATADASQPGDRGHVMSDVLQGLVDDGTLTQDQADKVKAAFDAALPLRGPGGPHGDHGMRGPGRGRLPVDDIAGFLGIDASTLKSDLQSGKSLADIAGDQTDALIAHLVEAANQRIDAAVSAGRMTADQAAELKTHTEERITNMVNNVRPAPPQPPADATTAPAN